MKITGEDAKILKRAVDRQKALVQGQHSAIQLYRARLAQEAETYMRTHLALADYQVRPALEKLQAPETLVIEVSAGAKVWRLGTVRAVAKALQWADLLDSQDGPPAVVLLTFADKTILKRSPDLLRLQYYMTESSPVQPLPLGYGWEAGSLNLPADKTPAPAAEVLRAVEERVLQAVASDLSRRADSRYPESGGDEVRQRIGLQFQSLNEAAQAASSLSAWQTRYLYQSLQEGLSAPPNLVVFPLSRTLPAFAKLIHKLFVCAYDIDPLNPEQSPQTAEALHSRLRTSPSEAYLRAFCSACFRACDAWILQVGRRVKLSLQCAACGSDRMDYLDAIETVPSAFTRHAVMPALGVALQLATSPSHHGEWADRVAQEVFHTIPPVHLYLSRRVRFRGMGEPPNVGTSTQLPRALFDMTPPQLLQALTHSSYSETEVSIQTWNPASEVRC